ncbi:MAG: RsmB/NOP family class I SAM-dependent RNA methyltransferase, partial [Lachnospiraceae bacterium]|nr:RsmB/NOP family class I SAM-dependent RNA methyltransferase [Lachnospiraceae bacterium]
MTNLPVEFENRMKEMLGAEYDEFRASYDDKKKTGIRVNTLKIKPEDFLKVFPGELTKVPWCDTGFMAAGDEKFGRNALHDAGAFYMQEPSAMAVAAGIAEKVDLKGLKVLDLCAAPGGKSTQLASYMANEGLLVSNEINRDRANILSSNIERCGIRNCVVLNETPDRIADAFEEYFDVVVVDAPCSGEGMFRKDETAVKEWSLENVKMCAERQEDILREAVKTVAPGGYIVYSTCTFAPAEDEEQIIRFLKTYPEFEVTEVPEFKYFDTGRKEWLSKDLSDEGDSLKKCARLGPHKIDGEGHFMCILKRA